MNNITTDNQILKVMEDFWASGLAEVRAEDVQLARLIINEHISNLITSQEFHEALMDYRTAHLPRDAMKAYEVLINIMGVQQ